MKKIIFAVLLSVLSFGAYAQDAAVKTPQVTETARAVAKLMPLEEQIDEFTSTVAANLPEEKRALFTSIMKKNIDAKRLREAAAVALVKIYTPAELEQMKTMHTEPGSKSIIDRMENFALAVQPTIEDMLGKGLEEAKKAGIIE